MKTDTVITNVLFVDDDADEFYLFNEAIEQSELPVCMSRAIDGNDLLKSLIGATLPDVILMDLNMPYKDGLETLIELRSNSSYKQIPVVIFSTSNNTSQINSCYKQGANMYVVKPQTFDEITSVVKKLFSFNWKQSSSETTESNFVLTY